MDWKTLLINALFNHAGEIIGGAGALIAAFTTSKWFQSWKSKNKLIGSMIENATTTAVARTEEEVVKPMKETTGLDKLTPQQQKDAFNNAVTESLKILGEAGMSEIKENVIPLIEQGVNKVVDSMHKDLPQNVQDRLP